MSAVLSAMSKAALNRALLSRQMLLAREAVTPLAAVERLIALQAQQPRPPFIGLWTRVAGFQREHLLSDIRERRVVRATLMRATLHLLSTKDYLRFRTSMQPALTAAMRAISRARGGPLDVEAVSVAAQACFAKSAQTFAELRAKLSQQFPAVDERAMGYVARTCLPLLTTPSEAEYGFGADATFAAASSYLKKTVATEDRTAELIMRYLAAFGPATAADAQAWSGLPNLKPVFEALRPELLSIRDERKRELFDLPNAPRPSEDTPAPVRFLPGFDNIVLSHADRSRIIADEHRPRVATKNLQILPTFLVEGFVAGTWELEVSKKSATLNITPFQRLGKAAKEELSAEGEQLVLFLAPDHLRPGILFKRV